MQQQPVNQDLFSDCIIFESSFVFMYFSIAKSYRRLRKHTLLWAGGRSKKKNAHPACVLEIKSLRNNEFFFLALWCVCPSSTCSASLLGIHLSRERRMSVLCSWTCWNAKCISLILAYFKTYFEYNNQFCCSNNILFTLGAQVSCSFYLQSCIILTTHYILHVSLATQQLQENNCELRLAPNKAQHVTSNIIIILLIAMSPFIVYSDSEMDLLWASWSPCTYTSVTFD